jgi:hypothetical protein
MSENECCPACGCENDTEDEYCSECTAKHSLGKECMEDAVKKLNLACKLCLEDVLEWFKEGGKVGGVGIDEQQVIEVIEGTLSGKYPPESFLSGYELRIGE